MYYLIFNNYSQADDCTKINVGCMVYVFRMENLLRNTVIG